MFDKVLNTPDLYGPSVTFFCQHVMIIYMLSYCFKKLVVGFIFNNVETTEIIGKVIVQILRRVTYRS